MTGQIAITRRVASLRGRSKPFLAEASDGLLYVVKYEDRTAEVSSLFCEAIGTLLCRALGISVPEWQPVLVPQAFIEAEQDKLLQDALRRHTTRSRLAFGSKYLGGEGSAIFEILPGSALSKIKNRNDFWLAWLFDVCAGQTDNRQTIYSQCVDGSLVAHFIDHGELLKEQNFDLRRKAIAAMYLDHRVYHRLSSHHLRTAISTLKSLDADKVWVAVRKVPRDWTTAKSLSALSERLDHFVSCKYIEEVVRVTAEVLEAKGQTRQNRVGNGREEPPTLLRFGL